MPVSFLERHLFVYHVRANCGAVWRKSGDYRPERLRPRCILPVPDRLAIHPFGVWPGVDAFLAWPHAADRACWRRAVALPAGLQAYNAGRTPGEHAADLADRACLEAWAAGVRSAAIRLEPGCVDRVRRQRA